MKTKHIILASLVILIAINFSCQKQEDVTYDKVENGEVTFFPLEKGNYWVYSVYDLSPDGKYTFKHLDSTYIVGTKKIKGNTYSEYRSSTSATYVKYLRDSIGYIIDDSGERLFHHSTADTIRNEKLEVFGFVISHTYRTNISARKIY